MAPQLRVGRRACFDPDKEAFQRGQTAVVALFVMLLLAFIGALFVTIIARNLANVGSANRLETAEYYAQAGVQYANDQLTNSDLGADWRPAPTPASSLSPNDPDYAYLTAKPYPFVRYNMGNGRFLLRVTYNPDTPVVSIPPSSSTTTSTSTTAATTTAATTAASTGGVALSSTSAQINNPLARYIKIESIGREGIVDSTDPTTFGAQHQNAMLIAYKAIMITDYARSETNVDNRSDAMNIGVYSTYDFNQNNDVLQPGIVTPGVYDFSTVTQHYSPYPIITQLGAPDAYLVLTNPTGPGSVLVPNPMAGSLPVTAPPNGGQWTAIFNSNLFNVAPGGGSFRSNGTTRFFGLNTVYLNSAGYDLYLNNNWAQTPITGMLLDEHMEIAGDLLLDQYNPTITGPTGNGGLGQVADDLDLQQAALLINPPPSAAVSTYAASDPFTYVAPSSAPPLPANEGPTNQTNPNTGFDSKGDAIRDGETSDDILGYPRSINKLAPPLIDSPNNSTGLTRYRDMAINSTIRNTAWTIPTNQPGLYGFGQVIYVNNLTDTQKESTVAGAAYSLTDEWLNRNSGASATLKNRWVGGVYTPPGVEITLGDLRPYGYTPSTGGSAYGVYLLRHDIDALGNPITWVDPTSGTLNQSGNPGMMVSYDSLGASNQLPATTTPTSAPINPDNDVVIVCEGNVRIHGCVSADPQDANNLSPFDKYPRHVTIITYGTAYIDGNLLKGNPDSSIAVLAHDYVCVNTTQFTAGRIVPGLPIGTTPPTPSLSENGALDFADNTGLAEEFSFGLPNPVGLANTDTPGKAYPLNSAGNSTLALYVEGATASVGGLGILDFQLNTPWMQNGLSSFTNSALPPSYYTFGAAQSVPPPVTEQGFGEGNLITIPLFNNTTLLNDVESNSYQLWITKDPNSQVDPVLSHVAILPMDIRIEAVLYAQTRSFFVIPGDWFNGHGDDTLSAYARTSVRGAGISDQDLNQARYPFYGQPIDCKVTIYGAVAEARPADIAAQNAWMQKWGWIPQFHGNLIGTVGGLSGSLAAELSGHNQNAASTYGPSAGLTIIYNPQCGYPVTSYFDNATGAQAYLRTDSYGNPLPFAPRLPVCTGLLYSGEAPQLPAS